MQSIYQGKTCKSLHFVSFPAEWHVSFTENHGCNEKIMVDYLEKVLFLYIDKEIQELKLDSNWPSSLTDFEDNAQKKVGIA